MWLSQELPLILNSAAFTNNGAVFITWDENDFSANYPIGMIVLSPRAKGGGYVSTNFYDHSSTVRTMQEIFGVRPFLGDAANVTGLGELFKSSSLTSVNLGGGLVRLTLSNLSPGRTNYLQSSTDLVHWTSVSTNVVPVTPLQFDVNINAPTYRFFRSIQAP